jgi:hypothetical protein
MIGMCSDFISASKQRLLRLKTDYISFRSISFNIQPPKEGFVEKPMNANEARWSIIKSLLEGFPSLKEKTLDYLQAQ